MITGILKILVDLPVSMKYILYEELLMAIFPQVLICMDTEASKKYKLITIRHNEKFLCTVFTNTEFTEFKMSDTTTQFLLSPYLQFLT
jgi:hypothetical protein